MDSGSRSSFLSSVRRARPTSPEAARLRDAYRAIAADRPLFAPHADSMFESLALLGVGGMSRVYRVRDHRLGREAALKILDEDGDPGERRARFLREARILARLDHPNIPPLYEAGEAPDGRLYMLIKLIEGRTLAEILERRFAKNNRRFARHPDLLEALVKVSEALAYAHEQGVIHRDIKPENIMIGRRGEVFLMDWGVSRDLRESQEPFRESAAGLTRDGSIIGTPGYMAPEQAMGDVADERADIFALGVVLTEVLTGQHAISVDDSRVALANTIGGQIKTPGSLSRGVPASLEELAARALDPDRRERFEAADDFTAALRAVLEPGSWTPTASRLGERVAAGLVVLSLAAAALFFYLETRAARRDLLSRQSELSESQRSVESLTERLAGAEEKAIEAAAEARGLRDDMVNYAMTTADTLIARRQFQAAITAINKVLAVDPENTTALNNRALSYIELGRFEAAGADLNALITIKPDYGSAYLNRGWMRGRQKDFQGALDDFDKAERLGFKRASLYNNRGWIYSQLNRRPDAIAAYSQAIEAEPGYLKAWINRAIAYTKAREPTLALRDYGEALKLAPGDPGLLLKKGALLNDLKRPREALTSLLEARRRAKDPAEALFELGRSYELMRRPKDAVTLYRAFLKARPQDRRAAALVKRMAELEAGASGG